MSFTQRRRAVLSVLIATAVAACTEPLAPRDIAGTYALRTLRGEVLPTRLNANVLNSPTLIADTLELHSSGNGEWIDVYEYESATPGAPPDTVRFSMPISILQEGGQLLLAERFVCPPGAICRDPEIYPISRWEGELVLGDGPRYYTKVPD